MQPRQLRTARQALVDERDLAVLVGDEQHVRLLHPAIGHVSGQGLHRECTATPRGT